MVATAIIPGDIWRYYTGNSRILFKRPERLTLLELTGETVTIPSEMSGKVIEVQKLYHDFLVSKGY